MDIGNYRKIIAFVIALVLAKLGAMGLNLGVQTDLIVDGVIGLVGAIGVFTFGNDHTSASFFGYAKKTIVALVAVACAWVAQHWGVGLGDMQDEIVNGVLTLAAPLGVYIFRNEAA